jgi:uncharacterized protein (TIGR00303 family)
MEPDYLTPMELNFPTPSFVSILNDPDSTVEPLLNWLHGKRGKFFLCIGGTQTSDIAGISAAGISPADRRLTPAIDAEALLCGRALSAETIPVSPSGVVSPIIMTRACLRLINMPIEVVDCGTFVSPKVACIKHGSGPSASVETGSALSLNQVEKLFNAGEQSGADASDQFDYIVVGECVPGGTTTALAVLTALGFDVRSMLSSSIPQPQHNTRFELVQRGLERSCLTLERVRQNPLLAVAAIGDPMQPFVAGMALSASAKIPVFLAGGSQMLAVFALYKQLAGERASLHLPIVATTKWVAFDPGARTGQVAAQIGAPYVASCPDFNSSKYAGLRAYEQGHVKEGTGAGAAMLVAHCALGIRPDMLLEAIDQTYSEVVLEGKSFRTMSASLS